MEKETPVIDIKKYGGKQIAVIKDKIVAYGVTTKEVLAKAKRVSPRSSWRDILIISVPKGLTVVYKIQK